MDFSNLSFANNIDDVTRDYSCAEIKEALQAFRVHIPKKFNDGKIDEKVKKLEDHLRRNSLLIPLLHVYLKNVPSSRQANPFDGSTLIPSSVDTFWVEPERITYVDNDMTHETYEQEIERVFCHGNWKWGKNEGIDISCAMTRIAHAGISVGGKSAQTKVASRPDAMSVSASLAAAFASMSTQVGRTEDAMYATMQAIKKIRGKEKEALIRLIESHVPKDPSRVPWLSLSGHKMAEWKGVTASYQFGANIYKTQLENFLQNIPKKGQGKFAREAYLGVPLGDVASQVAHKITLDDAGFEVGMSLLVCTADTMLVQFLRSNYGEKVIGMGTLYPMMPMQELKGRKFDAIYVPTPIKVSAGGRLSDVLTTLRDRLIKDLVCEAIGPLIVMVSPLVFYDRTYHKIFYSGPAKFTEKAEDSTKLRGEINMIEDEGSRYEALSKFDDLKREWRPPYSISVDDIWKEYILKMLKTKAYTGIIDHEKYMKEVSSDILDEPGRVMLTGLLSESAELYLEYVTAIQKRLQDNEQVSWKDRIYRTPKYIHEARIVSFEAISEIEAPIRISMESWTGTVLYSELLPKVKIVPILSYLLGYLRHCLRIIWQPKPISTNNYQINKVIAAAGSVSIDWMDQYGSLASTGLVQDWESLMDSQARAYSNEPPEEVKEQIGEQPEEINLGVHDEEFDPSNM